MEPLVIKFGGTSVGSPSAIDAATTILIEHMTRRKSVVCVVSAMAGITNLLLHAARQAVSGDYIPVEQMVVTLRERHRAVIETWLDVEQTSVMNEIEHLISAFEHLCRHLGHEHAPSAREFDAIASFGERMNARIVAAVLRARGIAAKAVDATEVIVTNAQFGHADPLFPETQVQAQARLYPLLADGIIPVVTGFIGATSDGIVTTLGRGGSDYSAAIIGVALQAAEVWIYTDVDGVMTADPRVVPDAHVIPRLTYTEARELAYFGATVLHPRTVEPLAAQGIPLWVGNTFNPTHAGTLITNQADAIRGTIKAITTINQASLITVEGHRMMTLAELVARTFAVIGRIGAHVLLISHSSAEQKICLVVSHACARALMVAFEEEESVQSSMIQIRAQDRIIMMSVIGEGIAGTMAVESKLFHVLDTCQLNALAMARSASQCSMSVVIDTHDVCTAVNDVHRAMILMPQIGTLGTATYRSVVTCET